MRRGLVVPLGLVMATASLVVAPLGASATATPTADQLLRTVLATASHQSSFSLKGVGSLSGHGTSLDFDVQGTVSFEKLVIDGFATISQYAGKSGQPVYVKSSTTWGLTNLFGVTSPTASEANVWYVINKSDSRYYEFDPSTGAHSVAQLFSFGTDGFSTTAKIVKTTALKGVKVIELRTLSNMFASGSGKAVQYLYVTDTAHPVLFATSGPSGISGNFYFGSWSHTTVTLPSPLPTTPLPS